MFEEDDIAKTIMMTSIKIPVAPVKDFTTIMTGFSFLNDAQLMFLWFSS